MKTVITIKLNMTLLLFALSSAFGFAQGTVTINLGDGILYGDNESTPLADGTLVFAVSDSAGIFGGPEIGSLISGSEVFLGAWEIDEVVGAPGAFNAALNFQINDVGLPQAGDQFRMIWIEGLNWGGSSALVDQPTPVGGERWGFFRDSDWLVPAPAGTFDATFATASIGGPLPESAGFTTLEVVPEPSTYAAILGFLALAFVGARRMRK